MTREEILNSPEYWAAQIQIALYNRAEEYMRENNLSRSGLAEHLGVSKGYVSQILNGDYDHKLSKLVELALAFGVVPKIDFIPIEEIVNRDSKDHIVTNWLPVQYKADSVHENVREAGAV